jgi:hypothetical protein
LPPSVRNFSRKDFVKHGFQALDYIASAAYVYDQANGIGICMTGNAALRGNLFPFIAKPFALARRSTWYCSVHSLQYLLEAGSDETRIHLANCETLFLDWFEKDFGNEGCPYTYTQRADIEQFLVTRLRSGFITNFSARAPWMQLKWWSRDLLEVFEPKIVDIQVS